MLYITTVNHVIGSVIGSALLALPLLFVDTNALESDEREDLATHHTGTHSSPTPSTPRPSTPKPRPVAHLEGDIDVREAINAPEACSMPDGQRAATCETPATFLRDLAK